MMRNKLRSTKSVRVSSVALWRIFLVLLLFGLFVSGTVLLMTTGSKLDQYEDYIRSTCMPTGTLVTPTSRHCPGECRHECFEVVQNFQPLCNTTLLHALSMHNTRSCTEQEALDALDRPVPLPCWCSHDRSTVTLSISTVKTEAWRLILGFVLFFVAIATCSCVCAEWCRSDEMAHKEMVLLREGRSDDEESLGSFTED